MEYPYLIEDENGTPVAIVWLPKDNAEEIAAEHADGLLADYGLDGFFNARALPKHDFVFGED